MATAIAFLFRKVNETTFSYKIHTHFKINRYYSLSLKERFLSEGGTAEKSTETQTKWPISDRNLH